MLHSLERTHAADHEQVARTAAPCDEQRASRSMRTRWALTIRQLESYDRTPDAATRCLTRQVGEQPATLIPITSSGAGVQHVIRGATRRPGGAAAPARSGWRVPTAQSRWSQGYRVRLPDDVASSSYLASRRRVTECVTEAPSAPVSRSYRSRRCRGSIMGVDDHGTGLHGASAAPEQSVGMRQKSSQV